MTTPLSAYMSENEISDADFAGRIGKDRTLVNRLRRGEVKPTLEVAAAIERETGGRIAMQAWVDLAHTAQNCCDEAAASDPQEAA